jgi:hypothetical protein
LEYIILVVTTYHKIPRAGEKEQGKMERVASISGRTAEKGGRNTLIPIPMKVFWAAVIERLNVKITGEYTYPYVAEVYRGDRRNAAVEAAIDDCVDITMNIFAKAGCKPRYPLERRPFP